MISSSYNQLFQCILEANTWSPPIALPSSLLTIDVNGNIIPHDQVAADLPPPIFTPIDIVAVMSMDQASLNKLKDQMDHEFPSLSAEFLIKSVSPGIESANKVCHKSLVLRIF
eukprot:6734890-Ditylum_brightwellii.AAC.1